MMQVVDYTTFIEGIRRDMTMTVGQWTVQIHEYCTPSPVMRDVLITNICKQRRFIQFLLTAGTTVMVPVKQTVSLSELHTCLNGRGTRCSYMILILRISVKIATQPVHFVLVVWVQCNHNSGVPIEDYMHEVSCQESFGFLVRNLDLTPQQIHRKISPLTINLKIKGETH